jgi:DinB superfamily
MSILASYKTSLCIPSLLALLAVASPAQQKAPPSPSKQINGLFAGVNKQILDMAQDFPADKYDFRLRPEMRSFGEVIVHVASGNVYAAKKGRGENVNWDEIDAKNYKTKAQVVALLQKSIADSTATLKSAPEDSFAKDLNPWLSVIEHSAEHYGLLVAYYRANGMVPPASRPQPKK